MKKNQVNAILTNQTKRRNVMLGLTILAVIFSIIAWLCFVAYSEYSKGYFVKYSETSNIDYKVLLRENEFFDNNYLESDKKYIASLIDYIDANFNYKLSLEEDVEYRYSYRIESEVSVKETSSDEYLYNKTKVLKRNDELSSSKTININEKLEIDYHYYNDIIQKFVSMYDLNNIESTLNINMYISVMGTCEDLVEDQEKESVMTLSIPLTTKTMAIDISDNLINSDNNMLQCKSASISNILFILIGVASAVASIGLIIYAIRYEYKTRTAENIYERALKKILNNYSSYIQTLDDDFEFQGYQLLKLNTFTDMLEIRDTVRQPILLKENETKTGAYFVIPASSKILYVYRLKVSDIEKKIKNDDDEIEEI